MHQPYSPDLAPSDCNIFWTMRYAFGDTKWVFTNNRGNMLFEFFTNTRAFTKPNEMVLL